MDILQVEKSQDYFTWDSYRTKIILNPFKRNYILFSDYQHVSRKKKARWMSAKYLLPTLKSFTKRVSSTLTIETFYPFRWSQARVPSSSYSSFFSLVLSSLPLFLSFSLSTIIFNTKNEREHSQSSNLITL